MKKSLYESAQWEKDYLAERKAQEDILISAGVYSPAQEHDACGVGMVVSIDGEARRSVVEAGIEALSAIWHRGAVDADGKTGDGAGIHVQIPQNFFKEHIERTGHIMTEDSIAVGMVFLPRNDFAQQEVCRTNVESEIIKLGYDIYGWRQVPVDISCMGAKANATRPEIEQIMISNRAGHSDEKFERNLFLIRRRIEQRVYSENINDFYICSLSCRSVVYKGMFLAEDLPVFYPDLSDERFVSAFAIYHQRYSTNTFPQWWLAQPFRMLAHNGEINTLNGNINWMKSHEIRMVSELFGDSSEDIKPIVQRAGSDSAALDNVFEVMVRAGRIAPLVKQILIPEVDGTNTLDSHRNMLNFCNAIMEPWDGPAALCATDGRWMIAGLDRNGLRPMRFSITKDNLLVVGSESGMVRLPEDNIVFKGRVGPGEIIGVDLESKKFFGNSEIKNLIADILSDHECIEKVRNIGRLSDTTEEDEVAVFADSELRTRQLVSGYSIEELEMILYPMAETGKEAIGSMGDDSPLAVLSAEYRGLHHFFRQNFSQVTNPPIDPIREERVMSLKTRFGNLVNVLDKESLSANTWVLDSPVLTNLEFKQMKDMLQPSDFVEIDCTFIVDQPNSIRDALLEIRIQAANAIRAGAIHVILSDLNVSETRIFIPMILAVSGIHGYLVEQGLRTFASLHVRTSECIDTHHFAVLIGCGATTVNAYLAQDSIVARYGKKSLTGGATLSDLVNNYKSAIEAGLLKIMSKMGISVISSYRGGYNFEAVGLSRALVDEFLSGVVSRISGIGLTGIQKKLVELHARAFFEDTKILPIGGYYKFRRNSETHMWEGRNLHQLQLACDKDSFSHYKKYVDMLRELPPINLRDLLDFKHVENSTHVDEVESVTAIRKRFITPGMSLGALSPEAHGTLNVAMNRIGSKSCSGEGGEQKERFTPAPNGDNWNSAIKQVASGRFGVTAEYLNQAREIEIKVAQGAKPGEGGQLPGFKVTVEIAKLRHATEGVTLISPPPHHDIYSIEDLAQLIYDLKQINPYARVCVKLVSRSGIGTIAAGVAKAYADVISVSGYSGGTGASPQTSVKYAGMPWELGLSEVNQVLTLNKLRHRVSLRVDGGIRSGRDIVIAAMLGAEEFGIGTASLIAMGCIMVRQCHSNTCPVGICTQRPDLRDKFTGTADKIVNLFTFIAEEVRTIIASIGMKHFNDIIGRSDLLSQVSRGASHLDDLDMNPILVRVESAEHKPYCTTEGRNEVADTLDAQIVKDAEPLFNRGEKMQLNYTVQNTHRAVGSRLSSMITRQFGMSGLQPNHIHIKLRGVAGQSLGAFAVQGVKLEVIGDANDYVGKGLSGGTIIVRPSRISSLVSYENVIIGNTVLYGATSGRLFASGRAGERFAVRNSGVMVVVEGVGDNACEYMTGGNVVILGTVGENFGAGMTGGMAFVYDADNSFESKINPDSIIIQRVQSAYYENLLKSLIQEHVDETGSSYAEQILMYWPEHRGLFYQVCGKEMLGRLEHPLSDAQDISQLAQ